jgi:hypothetical protein
MIINDLVQPVVSKLRGRTDVITSIPYYIAQTLIDLSENYEFEELKQTGPLTNFVEDICAYPISGYDPNGINGNPFIQSIEDKITFIRSWFTYFDTNGQVTLGQSTGSVMKDRDIRVVEPMSKISGLPTVYCIRGSYKNNGVILVGFLPDNPYPTQMTYQKQHPFSITFRQVMQSINDPKLSSFLGTSVVMMPDDWTEVIILAAAEKACYDIGLNEIGTQYHQQLYGYKDKKGNEMPGIITVRMTQQDRQASFNERQMRPVVRRFT